VNASAAVLAFRSVPLRIESPQMPLRKAPDEHGRISMDDLDQLAALVRDVPGWWKGLMITVAVVSAVHINIDAKHHATGSFAVGTLTAVALGLIWLPALVTVLGVSGGGLKTPAGEATTPGLAKLLEHVPADLKRETFPTILATLGAPEVVTNAAHTRETRALRRDLQLQLAAATPSGGGTREQLDDYARRYEAIRDDELPSHARTLKMTSLMAEARAVARPAPPALADLRHWLDAGKDGERVIALSILQDHPDPRLFDEVLDAVRESHSAFEQYQALGALLAMLKLLDGRQAEAVRETLSGLRDDPVRAVMADASRGLLIESIETQLDGGARRYG
jgi:hypothetical protein